MAMRGDEGQRRRGGETLATLEAPMSPFEDREDVPTITARGEDAEERVTQMPRVTSSVEEPGAAAPLRS